jgi:citrate lyase subunit beta/citryl-CoA lyase
MSAGSGPGSVDHLGRAILFCPGNRPDRFEKALAAAGAVIIDLEDAVPEGEKDDSRAVVCESIGPQPGARQVVRVNPISTHQGKADLAALRETGLRYVMLPKTESAAEVEAIGEFEAVALCETARGVQDAAEIASAEKCVALFWGGEDLTADIGGWSSRGVDGTYLPLARYARARVLVAAASARVSAWDAVFLDLKDLDGLGAEASEAAAMGFSAKVAVHPRQLPVIRGAYSPAGQDVEEARRLLRLVDEADGQLGVVKFEGRMVDGPLIAQARALVGAADGKE